MATDLLLLQRKETGRQMAWVLRVACSMCFIGHGAFGIITKPIWCNYFAVFGIGQATAYKLMPVVGALDIFMGLAVLFYPIRAVFVWLVGWGMMTALLRPLSGEPVAEFIERAGNYGAPLLLLLLTGIQFPNLRLWQRITMQPADDAAQQARVRKGLQIAAFLLLAGHAWLNFLAKKSLLAQYSALGFSDAQMVSSVVGIFELVAAVWILVRPAPQLVFALLCWKMGTELFYPHYEVFEWVERGGSYGVLLALWLAVRLPQSEKNGSRRSGIYSLSMNAGTSLT